MAKQVEETRKGGRGTTGKVRAPEGAGKAKAEKKKTGFWTLRKVLVALALTMTGALIYNQFMIIDRFQSFALSTQRDNSRETLSALVNDRISRQYLAKITPLVAEWARHPRMRGALQSRDPKKMMVEANALHGDAVFTLGEFSLVGVSLLDKDMKPLVTSSKGSGDTVLSIPEIRQALLKRDKAAQRKEAGFYWRTKEGRPVHSTIAPIGGFRVLGFLEIVTDPIGMLRGLGGDLGGLFELRDVNGKVLLKDGQVMAAAKREGAGPKDAGVAENAPGRSDTATGTAEKGKDDPSVRGRVMDTVSFDLPDSGGQTWARASLTRDVSDFAGNVNALRNNTLMVIGIGVVLAWLIGWAALQFTLFGKLKRFAGAMLQISKGDTAITLPPTGNDELARISEALQTLRSNVDDAFQLRTMVASDPNPIALCERDGRAYFMNDAARAFLGDQNGGKDGTDANIAALLDFDEEMREILADENRLPRKALLHVGERIIEVEIAAVRDVAGRHVRTKIAWEDVSERERLSREVAAQKAEAEKRAAEIAEANRRTEARAARMDELIRNFDGEIKGLFEQIGGVGNLVRDASSIMVEDTGRNLERAREVATASAQASSNVETVAAAAEEMTASVREIQQRATSASDIAHDAVAGAERANITISGLARTADRIGEVIGLINDIASQTNLLALNATIEAARAGDAGKGFAVVASEVKNLAGQTEKATEEISSQIAAIQKATNEAVSETDAIGKTIARINEIAAEIAAAVEEQGAATAEIARSAKEAADATTGVNHVIDEVRQAAENNGQRSQEMQGAANELIDETATMQERISHFLNDIRRA